MNVYDNAEFVGRGNKDLVGVLGDIAESTKTLELKARDLKIMTFTNYDPATGVHIFQAFYMRWDKKRGRFAPDHMGDTITADELRAIGADAKIEEELRAGVRTMIDVAGERFFMNPCFLKTYMQRGGSSPGDFAKSPDLYCRINRDFGVIAFLAATDPDLKMTLLYRENRVTRAKKALALFSETGTYVPQVNFWNAISKEFRKVYGAVSVDSYRITQERTFIYAELPGEKKEYTSRYPKVPDECTPGFTFQTSDVGLSSITTEGTMRIGKGGFFVIPKAEASRSHKGYVEIKTVAEECRKKVIRDENPSASPYALVMNRLSALTDIAVHRDLVLVIIKKILTRSGLLKTLGSKRSARLVTDALKTLEPGLVSGSVTAYDIAKALLDHSGKYQLEFQDADTIGRLRREFAGAVTFAYEKEVK